jgi:hypothetical protein
MTFPRRAALLALSLAAIGALPAWAQSPDADRVVLAPHRAVYDLRLDTSRPSRNVDGATGRIAFDFTGDACDGYALNFRQVTVLQSSETGAREIDVRTSNFEEGDGRLFRFKSQSGIGGRIEERTDGTAERQRAGFRVNTVQPKRDRFEFPADVVFPSEHLKRVIRAARKGETTLNIGVYDGSDEGKQVYDTLAVIGRRIEGGPERLDEASRKEPLLTMPRWPVTISYFKRGSGEQTPSYTIAFELFDNGVTRALRLDYQQFRLLGELVRLELMQPTACQK